MAQRLPPAQTTKTWLQGGHSTSSPSSLYAQKRKPPLSLRQDANRSTPSLLSQSSPPRRSPSPGMRRSGGNIAQDWSRRNGSASGNTSPARSTLSFASTVNLYASASGTSNTTTPGKLAPSSPLYYDYTEDFEVDDYNQAAKSLGSPPLFSIDKTIPEERPTSAERSISTESRAHRLSNSVRLPSAPSPRLATPKPLENTEKCKDSQLIDSQFEPFQTPLGEIYTSVQQDDTFVDKRIVRLSDLGYGAQELSTHVEEAFGLLRAASFEISVPRTTLEAVTSGDPNGEVADDSRDLAAETQPIAIFPKRPDAHPPRLSSLPSARKPQRHEGTAAPDTERSVNIMSQLLPTSKDLLGGLNPPTGLARSDELELGQGSTVIPALSSSQNRLYPSSGCEPVDTGFSGLSDLIKTLEESHRGRHSEMGEQVFTSSGKPGAEVPPSPNDSKLHNKNINQAQRSLTSSLNRSNAKHLHASTQVPPTKRTQHYDGFHKEGTPTRATYIGFRSPNFNNQAAMRDIPRSESPMLAPKPISPARQLKLKNSVPQLMKALPPLPPLPPEPTLCSRSPASKFDSFNNETPCSLSPLLPDTSTSTSRQEMRYEPDNATPCPGLQVPAKQDKSNAPIDFDFRPGKVSPIEEQADSTTPALPQPPARLKLKLKSYTSLRPVSPSSPEPLGRECAYTSSISGSNSASAGASQSMISANTKAPKFRLKITRASSSSFGTVRVNRDSGESNPVAAFHLRNHKDLFTSTTGIDHILRQVGQHLHSRKASEVSNTGSDCVPPLASFLSPNGHVTHNNTSLTTGPPEVPEPLSTTSVSSHEARSFFSDDNSHVQGRSMRDRISHFRARITVPHGNRSGSQSCDDLTWKDRNRPEATALAAQRSASNLHSKSKSTESKPLRSLTNKRHRHRLREKVKGWLKEARLVFKSRMKSRATTGSGQDEERS